MNREIYNQIGIFHCSKCKRKFYGLPSYRCAKKICRKCFYEGKNLSRTDKGYSYVKLLADTKRLIR